MTNPMALAVLVSIASVASPAATEPGGLFEIHAESAPGNPNAAAWRLPAGAGPAQVVYLDPAVLLDQRSIATADVVRGPDGAAQIRLGLTSDGAGRLAEILSRSVGRRLGVVSGGKLRSAPYVTGGPAGNVLVVAGGLSDAEAAALAPKLGPPSPVAQSAAPGRVRGSAIPELQGRWRTEDATMNGRPVHDPKIAAASWFFRGDVLALTNGEGKSQRFTTVPESAGVFRIEPEPSASSAGERGGWILWAREKGTVLLAFHDDLERRPDGFAPAPKKVLVRLRPSDIP